MVKRTHEMACEVRHTYSTGDTFTSLLISDLHIDNPKCKRETLMKDLEKAKAIGAKIYIFGDLFCLMQGKYDPRSSKHSLRPEHMVHNYIDSVIDDTAHLLAPYAHLITVISDGNHETNIVKRLETDPLERLCEILRTKFGSPVVHLPYMGFIVHRYEFQKKGSEGEGRTNSRVRSSTWFFSHGHWGGVISKGTQAASRYSAMAPQADLIYSGHTHDRNMMELMRYNINTTGAVKIEPQLYLKGGAYKEEFESGGGWAVEKLAMPKNIGGWWVSYTVGVSEEKYSCWMT